MAAQSDIQATHQIIQLFEHSKMQADDDLDSLPGIHAVVDLDGRIYRGNKSLGRLLKTDHEYLLGRNITELFSPYDWMHLHEEMVSSLKASGIPGDVQADITVQGVRSSYVWNFVPLTAARRSDLPSLMTIIGRDITEQIRATQRNARMVHELEMARLIQAALFPQKHAQFDESSVAGFYMSATECAGDWWYYKLINEKLYIWIGDVEGHGVPSAMITSAVRAAVSLIDKIELNPSKMLSVLSNVVLSVATDQKVMTFSVAEVDLRTGEMIYSNAAHEPGLIIGNQSSPYKAGDIQSLASDPAVPLGTNPDFVYAEGRLKLKRGDRVVFFTDGVYNVVNKFDQKWTRVSLRRSILPHVTSPMGSLDFVNKVENAINEFRDGAQLVDDVTFVVFQY